MDGATGSTGEAEGLDALLPLMVALSRRTEDLMDRRRLSERDIQHIERPVATIRLLLTALASLRSASGGVAAQAPFVGELAERYLELEGRIKELRNDLTQDRKRVAAP